MPKSKRNKQVELAKTKKRGLEWKKKLFEEIRSAVDTYSNVYIFTVNDMRNSKMKSVRDQWKDSRFFIGKNKIMAMALGRFAEEEYKPNLHKIGQRMKGPHSLLFSNRSSEDVLSWFRSYSEGDYARSGNIATEDVKLYEGPLPEFPHSLEPYLRQLGLPTSLVKGVVYLVKDHEVCKEGDKLTPETAKILKLLGYQMAEFHISINCVWSQDGTFLQFTSDEEANVKENKKKNKHKSNFIETVITPRNEATENMEVEEDRLSESDSSEVNENEPEIPKVENSKVTSINNNIEIDENEMLDIQEKEYEMAKTKDIDNTSILVENDVVEVSDSSNEKKDNECEILEENDNECEILEENENECEILNENVNECEILEENVKECEILEENECEKLEKSSENNENEISPKNSKNVNKNTSTPIDKDNDFINILNDESDTNISDKTPVNRVTKRAGRPSVIKNADVSNTRQSRPRKRQADSLSAKDSLIKTPDPANSSQDSPLFRELRSRSVKVSRKKKK